MAKRDSRKHTYSDEELDKQFKEASRLGKEARREPRAKRAYYDRNRGQLALEMLDGSLMLRPVATIQGLSEASPHEVSSVTLTDDGDILQWDSLKLDLSVAGLVAGILGTRTWMAELGRRGGSVTTEAKAAAARDNGRKGGRPPKAKRGDKSYFDTLLVDADLLQPEMEVIELAVSGQSQQATNDVIRYRESLLKIERGLPSRKRLTGSAIESADVIIEPKIEGIEETQKEVPAYATFAAAA